ncbi:MAG: hypothetical protein FWH12_05635 [Treponema sp.]|nr:hypothetical protein [Treponema sp.]
MISPFISLDPRRVLLILGLGICASTLYPQDPALDSHTRPEALRRPEGGESPRLPQDLVIGELGQGQSPDGAYAYAREFLDALLQGRGDAPILLEAAGTLRQSHHHVVDSISPRTVRLGGGRFESDGSVSFILRFIGPQESITGELYLRETEGIWELDDLILEEKRELGDLDDSYRFDFSPYERFY